MIFYSLILMAKTKIYKKITLFGQHHYLQILNQDVYANEVLYQKETFALITGDDF